MIDPSTKSQTAAQRIASAVWLRAQIKLIVAECAVMAAADEYLYAREGDPQRRARFEATRQWQRCLESLLSGLSYEEHLAVRVEASR